MRVSVIGGSSVPPETAAVAERLGERLADRGHTVVCGGLGGVMEAVCRGAREEGGETIGILPTDRRSDANPHVTVPIATGMGHARNALVVLNGDAAIAVDGTHGTLSEIGLALAHGRAVAGIDT
ncbi:MAG: TIGR00725 family protein, partial [Halobacteriota archaeon]